MSGQEYLRGMLIDFTGQYLTELRGLLKRHGGLERELDLLPDGDVVANRDALRAAGDVLFRRPLKRTDWFGEHDEPLDLHDVGGFLRDLAPLLAPGAELTVADVESAAAAWSEIMVTREVM